MYVGDKVNADIMSDKKCVSSDMVTVPRTWWWLPTIDGYVAREFLIKLSVLLLVFVILFILGDVFNDLDDFLDADASMSDFIAFLLAKLPGNVRFVLPISMLLGCMWTMATFGKNLEVTAMRASGVSLFRCGAAILFMGLVMTAVNIYFNEALVPYTERNAQVIRNRAVDRVDELTMHSYRSPDRERTWFFQSFISGGDNTGVTLKKQRNDKTLEWDIVATKVRYVDGVGWKFINAIKTPYSRDGLMPKASEKYDELIVPHSEIPEEPEDIINAIKDEDMLSAWTLWGLIHNNPDMPHKVKSIYLTAFYFRIAFPWACFLAVFLGIPLATKNERSGSLMAIIMAVVMIIAYIVIAQIFMVFGKRGLIPPVIAGLAPTIAFIIYGYCKVFYNRS